MFQPDQRLTEIVDVQILYSAQDVTSLLKCDRLIFRVALGRRVSWSSGSFDPDVFQEMDGNTLVLPNPTIRFGDISRRKHLDSNELSQKWHYWYIRILRALCPTFSLSLIQYLLLEDAERSDEYLGLGHLQQGVLPAAVGIRGTKVSFHCTNTT
jgi:hypothetical protein